MRSPQTKLLSLDRSAPELRGHQSTISSQIQTAATDMQSYSEKYHMMPLLHNDAPSANPTTSQFRQALQSGGIGQSH